jgi:spore coat polysaccharide biosynthesis protein SpsF (cytidylyltransferase family)
MRITPEMLESIHIRAVGAYLCRANDDDHLRALIEGKDAFLHQGDLEEALERFQTVYDAIPAAERITKEHAHLILIEARRCERHSQQK